MKTVYINKKITGEILGVFESEGLAYNWWELTYAKLGDVQFHTKNHSPKLGLADDDSRVLFINNSDSPYFTCIGVVQQYEVKESL